MYPLETLLLDPTLNKITSKTYIHSYQDLFSRQDENIIKCYVNAKYKKNLRHEEFCVSPSAESLARHKG